MIFSLSKYNRSCSISLPRFFLVFQATHTASVCRLPVLLVPRDNLPFILLSTKPTNLWATAILQLRVRNSVSTISWLMLNWYWHTATDQCGNPVTPGGVLAFSSLIAQNYLTANGTPAPGIDFIFDTCSETVRICVFLTIIKLKESQPFLYNNSTQVMVSYDNAESFGMVFLLYVFFYDTDWFYLCALFSFFQRSKEALSQKTI